VSEKFDVAALVEMMATQKAALDRVQGLLDEVYPGLKATFTFDGLSIQGPQTQFARFLKDFDAFTAKKEGKEPPKEH
jgi:hypothetical protein